MSKIEHTYEIFFFLSLVGPLVYLLYPRIVKNLHEKINTKRENKKQLFNLIKSLEAKQGDLRNLITSETDRHSKLPNYLDDFEKKVREEAESNNQKVITNLITKISSSKLKKMDHSKKEAIGLFMQSFSQIFKDSIDKRIDLEGVLTAISQNYNSRNDS